MSYSLETAGGVFKLYDLVLYGVFYVIFEKYCLQIPRTGILWFWKTISGKGFPDWFHRRKNRETAE